MGSRRKFNIDLKRKIVQELGSRPVEAVCREYEIQRLKEEAKQKMRFIK